MADSYVNWLNEHNESVEEPGDPIIRDGWKVELDPSYVLYISIDAVYVCKQSETHEAGGKSILPQEKPKISHWNISVEFDDQIYVITDTYLSHAMTQLVAFILENGLYHRYFTFFTDGETCIFDQIDWFFTGWEHSIYLDFYHCSQKIYDKLSLAIIKERKRDPRGDHEYYKKGPKAKQVRKEVKTSLSVLYARQAARILYVGDIPTLIKYLENIKPEEVKNRAALDELIDYFKRKGVYCTCYALRRRLGLRNSSNVVEATNNRNTSSRMKHRCMTWSLPGSSSIVSLKTVKLNRETGMWYDGSSFSFRQARSADEMSSVNEPTILRVSQFEGITPELLKKYGPKNNARPTSKKPRARSA